MTEGIAIKQALILMDEWLDKTETLPVTGDLMIINARKNLVNAIRKYQAALLLDLYDEELI